jgi:hypothetical protein
VHCSSLPYCPKEKDDESMQEPAEEIAHGPSEFAMIQGMMVGTPSLLECPSPALVVTVSLKHNLNPVPLYE